MTAAEPRAPRPDGTRPTLDHATRSELTDLYARYTHAFDEGDADAVATLFTREGEFIRRGAAPVRGRDALAAMVRAAAARGAGTRHLVTGVLVRPAPAGATGPTAHGTAYVQVVAVGDDALRLVALGRYEDEFAVEDGAWRIRSRVFEAFTSPALGGATLAGPVEPT